MDREENAEAVKTDQAANRLVRRFASLILTELDPTIDPSILTASFLAKLTAATTLFVKRRAASSPPPLDELNAKWWMNLHDELIKLELESVELWDEVSQ